ncbi:Hsp20/alpha crystallin family protein [Desulfobacterales bacterium HSG2]|nr:Hsp20/alpha crystallin family protein [Desulfobacterales bacterium HSG2]
MPMRWDPFRNISTLQSCINRAFEEAFPPRRGVDDEEASLCAWKPVTDIYETDEGIVIKAELPGVGKEDVSVEIKDNILTLKGERSVDEEISGEKYYRKERCFGTFHRSFTMRDIVDPDKIKAKFKDGVLEVLVPKPEEDKPRQIRVNIE